MITKATDRLSESWCKVCELMGLKYGEPLPQKILTFGNSNVGWFVELNATRKDQKDFKAYSVNVVWNGFPAGILWSNDGVIAAGDAANENTLIEWLVNEMKNKLWEKQK